MLQNEAGDEPTKGLRQLAQDLYDKANQLHGAVSGSEVDAAKVLQAKAGTSDKEEGKLRKLAKDLYDAVSALHNAAKATSGDENTSATLAWVIGSSESKDGLRKALQLLAGDPTQHLQGVRENYDHVKNKFDLVHKQNNKGKYTGAAKAAYDKVEKAWNAFNAVYKPEELLKDAVGNEDQPGEDGEPKDLRQALHQLAGASILSPGIHKKAQNVKEKYQDVLGKFNKVQDQKDAYKAGSSTIKTNYYDPLEKAFNDFNNA